MDLVDDDYHEVTAEERQLLLEQRKKQHHEESDFPDEVQVPEDIKARDRFARYRSLKSFRKSPWDAKENLPDSYATIYHFSSFKQTQRTIMNDMKYLAREAEAVQNQFFGKTYQNAKIDTIMENGDEDDDALEGCVPSGSYVTITFQNVPKDVMDRVSPNALLTAVALLPHENKVSVLHMGLSQSPGCDMNNQYPVKSKDVLTFRCGWRTWQGRPVFSQINLNCDKHKYERFLPTGGAFFAASIFGPVTYTPCPVLVFREKSLENPRRELVAIGSILGADADRIVVKRIVLTGYPVRVHKRHATVKYMFYDPEDVKWFKPAGLHTKHGLQGNIVQSVGEHGTMKCLFNAPIKQHDTVCLPLYKRIFPKYVVSNRNNGGGSDVKSRSGMTTYREHKPSLIIL
jgi:pre-rRNA-processing protein TSR1